jgi:hypothetical protein
MPRTTLTENHTSQRAPKRCRVGIPVAKSTKRARRSVNQRIQPSQGGNLTANHQISPTRPAAQHSSAAPSAAPTSFSHPTNRHSTFPEVTSSHIDSVIEFFSTLPSHLTAYKSGYILGFARVCSNMFFLMDTTRLRKELTDQIIQRGVKGVLVGRQAQHQQWWSLSEAEGKALVLSWVREHEPWKEAFNPHQCSQFMDSKVSKLIGDSITVFEATTLPLTPEALQPLSGKLVNRTTASICATLDNSDRQSSISAINSQSIDGQSDDMEEVNHGGGESDSSDDANDDDAEVESRSDLADGSQEYEDAESSELASISSSPKPFSALKTSHETLEAQLGDKELLSTTHEVAVNRKDSIDQKDVTMEFFDSQATQPLEPQFFVAGEPHEAVSDSIDLNIGTQDAISLTLDGVSDVQNLEDSVHFEPLENCDSTCHSMLANETAANTAVGSTPLAQAGRENENDIKLSGNSHPHPFELADFPSSPPKQEILSPKRLVHILPPKPISPVVPSTLSPMNPIVSTMSPEKMKPIVSTMSPEKMKPIVSTMSPEKMKPIVSTMSPEKMKPISLKIRFPKLTTQKFYSNEPPPVSEPLATTASSSGICSSPSVAKVKGVVIPRLNARDRIELPMGLTGWDGAGLTARQGELAAEQQQEARMQFDAQKRKSFKDSGYFVRSRDIAVVTDAPHASVKDSLSSAATTFLTSRRSGVRFKAPKNPDAQMMDMNSDVDTNSDPEVTMDLIREDILMRPTFASLFIQDDDLVSISQNFEAETQEQVIDDLVSNQASPQPLTLPLLPDDGGDVNEEEGNESNAEMKNIYDDEARQMEDANSSNNLAREADESLSSGDEKSIGQETPTRGGRKKYKRKRTYFAPIKRAKKSVMEVLIKQPAVFLADEEVDECTRQRRAIDPVFMRRTQESLYPHNDNSANTMHLNYIFIFTFHCLLFILTLIFVK